MSYFQNIRAPPRVVRSLGKTMVHTPLAQDMSQGGVIVLGLGFEFGLNFGLGLGVAVPYLLPRRKSSFSSGQGPRKNMVHTPLS